MKYVLKYYRIVDGEYVLDTTLEPRLISGTARKSSEPKNNSSKFKFSNPIIDFFADGSPRRLFVDANKESVFRASRDETGFDSFEEKVEFYAKDVTNIEEDIENQDNLIFAGQIKEVEYVHEEGKCYINLTLSDRTFNILNRIWSNNYEGETYAEIMQNVIRQVVEDNSAPGRGGYSLTGVSGDGPYYVDARLFTEGIKGTDTITYSNKTITLDTGIAGVEVGDLIKNNDNYQSALVKSVDGNDIGVSKNIFTDGDSVSISNAFIQDWRPGDGSVFPDLSYGKAKKPAIEWIAELVQVENTNDASELESTGTKIVKRPLKYYVDGQNRFHCFYPDNSPSVEVKVDAIAAVGDDLNRYRTYTSKMKRGVFEVINYIIFAAGEDMEDRTYTGYAQDPSSGGPNIKDSNRQFPKVSVFMKLQDYFAGNIVYNSGTDFDYPTSYPMVPAWSSTGDSVSSDFEYNLEFRKEGRRRGKAYALRIINQSAVPRWKGTTELSFFNFNASDLVKFTDSDNGLNQVLVRIKEVQHNFTGTGFFTTLTLEGDLPEVN